MTKEELKKQIAEMEEKLDYFDCQEYVDESSFDDYIDEMEGEIELLGMKYSPSTVLKEVDPIAYRCTFNDYCNSLEPDSFEEYQDLEEEIEELKSQLEEMEEDDE